MYGQSVLSHVSPVFSLSLSLSAGMQSNAVCRIADLLLVYNDHCLVTQWVSLMTAKYLISPWRGHESNLDDLVHSLGPLRAHSSLFTNRVLYSCTDSSMLAQVRLERSQYHRTGRDARQHSHRFPLLARLIGCMLYCVFTNQLYPTNNTPALSGPIWSMYMDTNRH